jgi:hypothetical protein
MLWYFDKISDDDDSVVYAYGWNTRETTGQFKYGRKTGEIAIIKIADNDDQKGAEWAASFIGELLEKGLPEKTHIQIG